MTVTTTTRFGLTQWSAGTDPFTRAQLEASLDALEGLAAGWLTPSTAAARPAAAAANAGFLHKATDTGAISLSDGAAWVTLLTLAGGTLTGALSLAAAPTADLHAATKAYVDAATAVKRVRTASYTNVTLATGVENGDTVGGVVLATGDRVALLGQTAGAENGIYVVPAAGAPTRAADFDASVESLSSTLIAVSEGTYKDSLWQLTTDAAITLGTTALVFFPIHLQGAGTPEGVVAAPVGARYMNTTGGAGTTLYVKESGVGNTGWVALGAAVATIGDLLDEQFVRKTSDETVTASTTLQADDELLLAIGASQTWVYEWTLFVVGAAAGDIKLDLTVPASATGRYAAVGAESAQDPAVGGTVTFITDAIPAADVLIRGLSVTFATILTVTAIVVNSTNAGSVGLRWAQNAASGVTTVKANSYLTGKRYA